MRSSIAKVVIPFLQQHFLILFDQSLDTIDFIAAVSAAILQSNWVKPEFRFVSFTLNMDMRWFTSVCGVEKETIMSSLMKL
jgi:hypothetical protein